jgi:hypothetical protein
VEVSHEIVANDELVSDSRHNEETRGKFGQVVCGVKAERHSHRSQYWHLLSMNRLDA